MDGRWWVSRRDSRWLGLVSQCCLAGGLGVPLTITPPSELHQPDAMVTSGMGQKGMEPKAKVRIRQGAAGFLCMKIINCVSGITEIIPVLPSVVLHAVSFPFDQLLQLLAEHAAVEDFFHHILFLAVNKFRRWWQWCMSTSDGVDGC